MSKSSFTINQFISSVIVNVDFAEKDGWKGDIIFYQSKKFGMNKWLIKELLKKEVEFKNSF